MFNIKSISREGEQIKITVQSTSKALFNDVSIALIENEAFSRFIGDNDQYEKNLLESALGGLIVPEKCYTFSSSDIRSYIVQAFIRQQCDLLILSSKIFISKDKINDDGQPEIDIVFVGVAGTLDECVEKVQYVGSLPSIKDMIDNVVACYKHEVDLRKDCIGNSIDHPEF